MKAVIALIITTYPPIHLAVAHSHAAAMPLEERRGESDRGPPARANNANVFSRCHSYLGLGLLRSIENRVLVATSAPEIYEYFPSRSAVDFESDNNSGARPPS